MLFTVRLLIQYSLLKVLRENEAKIFVVASETFWFPQAYSTFFLHVTWQSSSTRTFNLCFTYNNDEWKELMTLPHKEMSLKVEKFGWGKNKKKEKRKKRQRRTWKQTFTNPKHEHGETFLLNNFVPCCKTLWRYNACDYQTTRHKVS